MTNRLTPIVAGLLLLGACASLADDLEEFLYKTGSLSISTESAGQPNRVEGRIFAPVAPNDTGTANFLLDLSAYINAGSNDITEYHDDKGHLGGSFRIGHRQLNTEGDWIYGVHSAYSVRNMDGNNYQTIAVGIEALSANFDARFTGIIPVDTTVHLIQGTKHLGITLGGVELSLVRPLSERVSGEIAAYYRDGDYGSNSAGIAISTQIQVTGPLSCGISISHDDLYDTRVSGNLLYEFGKGHSSNSGSVYEGLVGRLGQPSGLNTSVVRIHDPIWDCCVPACDAASLALRAFATTVACGSGATPIACAEQVAWDVCWLLDDAGIIDAKAVCGGASFTTAAARCAEGGTAACVSAATSVVLKAMGC
jgi:hypothetical protein